MLPSIPDSLSQARNKIGALASSTLRHIQFSSNSVISKSGSSLSSTASNWLQRNRSLVLRQTPFWAQSVLCVVLSLGGISLLGAIFFRIDEVVTVRGQLVSSEGSHDVKTPVGGRISEVYYNDGDYVQKGDLLLLFDTRAASQEKSTVQNLLNIEQLDKLSKLNILDSREKVLKAKLATTEMIVDDLEILVRQGGFQRIQYRKQLDELYALQTEYTSLQLEKERIKLDSARSIGQLTNRLKQAELQLQYQTVVSPVSGILFNSIASPQSVFQGGQRLLTIVPQVGLAAEVFIPNKDIGFVKPGQKARVRVDAFPFTKYGEISATVASIGASSLPPDETSPLYRFPLSLDLSKSNLQFDNVSIPLRSGMSITVNLKLRDKRVISLLSDILVDQTDAVKSIRQQ